MAEPKQKSLELPSYLTRIVPLWQTPTWMEAERWRRVVENQPVSAVCMSILVNDLQGTDWQIKAKDENEQNKLKDDIDYYTDILNPDLPGALSGFDMFVSLLAQDMLTLPVGGNCEIVRYRNGGALLSRPHPKGHVFKLAYIDGATVGPTYDQQYPMVQRVKGDMTRVIYFERNEIMRLVMSPRPEIERWGYGMAPPEKIYLAINLLYRGDTYYANLLLDTPEAGLLDLLDMSRESAEEWLTSFRELFQGIDPFKIPVLYEHEKPANFISFGRPPTDMLYDQVTLKYAQITAAGYGLSLSDVNLGDPSKTLAGSIRDERKSRRSGFGVVREKVRTAINDNVLPPYLEFVWIENDEEAKVQKGRALLTYAQALKAAKEANFITDKEGQAELVKQGLITVEVEEPEEPQAPPLPAGPPAPNGNGNSAAEEAQKEVDKIPAEEGGRGDITGQATQKAAIDVARTQLYKTQLASIFKEAFAGIHNRMEAPRLMKLIKAATRAQFPDITMAFLALSDTELPWWKWERAKMHFGEKSEFDELPDVVKANEELAAELDRLLDKDKWWQISLAVIASILEIIKAAFAEGAELAAQDVQEFLYTEGLRDTPTIIGLDFNLKNARTLAELESKAALLVRRVNDGTRYYLRRIITSGVDEGLASPTIAQMIRDGATVEEILREAGYTSQVIDTVRSEVGAMTEGRTNSIVNTEINRAESEGRLGQWREMGLTKKMWKHTGADDACPICRDNEALGYVDLDYVFEDVFDGTLTPPGHPNVCHCHIQFDEQELIDKADTLNVWTGE